MSEETKDIQPFRLLRLGKIAAMFGGFPMLLLEIRFQHRAALIDDWRPWIPNLTRRVQSQACGEHYRHSLLEVET